MDCKCCREKFDKQLRKPFALNCGHTFCSLCLISLKNQEADYECPRCQEPITRCEPNYTVMDILDMNLIVDSNATLRQEVKNSLNETKEAYEDLQFQCNSKTDEIHQRIDEIKEKVSERAALLIEKIKAQQGFLIGEANKIQQNLLEQIQTIAETQCNHLNTSCEQMEKKELEDLLNELTETSELVNTSRSELDKIDCLIEFRIDEHNEYEIGRIDCNCFANNNQSESYYEQAVQLIKSNNYYEAIRCLNKVTEDGMWFRMDEAYFLKGKCFTRLNKIDDAMIQFDKAILLNHVGACNYKGFLVLDKTDARLLFEKALELNDDPSTAEEYYNKALSLDGLENYMYAISYYDYAIELNPNYVEAYSRKAWSLYNMEKYDESLQCCRKAIDLNPNFEPAHTNKGLNLHRLERYKEAIECFDRAISLNQNDGHAYTLKGLSLVSTGKYPEAMTMANKAIELNGYDADAHEIKGMCMNKFERYGDAVKSFDKAIELKPSQSVYVNKGLALYNLEKYSDAVKCYDKALGYDQDNLKVLYYKGTCLACLEKYKDAIEYFDKIIKIDKNYALAYYEKGLSLDNMGKYKEAIDCYDKAIQIDPAHLETWDERGMSLNNLKKYQEAIKSFDKAIEINPNYAVVYNHKGWTLTKLERFHEAIACYDKAIALDPNLTEAVNFRNLSMRNIEMELELEFA